MGLLFTSRRASAEFATDAGVIPGFNQVEGWTFVVGKHLKKRKYITTFRYPYSIRARNWDETT